MSIVKAVTWRAGDSLTVQNLGKRCNILPST